MREIKFRCWDNLTKKMYPQNGLLAKIEFDNDDNKIFAVGVAEYQQLNEEGDCDWELFELKNQDELILMQFTGLIDKYGKKIYEGDRIKGQSTGVREVIFDKGCFVGQLEEQELPSMDEFSPSCDFILPLYLITNYCEVIGNIYEGK